MSNQIKGKKIEEISKLRIVLLTRKFANKFAGLINWIENYIHCMPFDFRDDVNLPLEPRASLMYGQAVY